MMHVSQVKAFFSRVWDKISSRISKPEVKREHILLYISLILILVSSFLLRIYPVFSTDILLSGLDPWVQLRCSEYLNEHGLREFINWFDQTSWYPYGRYMGKSMYILIPILAVVCYKIAIFLGFNVSMLTVAYFVPAVMGTITVFVIYKLGVIIHSKRTGVFAAFFISMANGFISRSIVGFYDNECIGVLLMFLCFYFFAKGLVKDSMLNNILAGISLGGLSLGWGAYRYAYDFLALYAFLMILLKKYSRRLLASFSTTILIGLFMGMLIPRNGFKFVISTEQIIPLVVLVIMVVITVYQELQKNIEAVKLKKITLIATIGVIIVGIIGTIILYALGIIVPIGDKFIRTLFPTLAETLPLVESVAENLTGSWATLFFNIYIMVFLLPLGFYFCIKKPTEKTVFLLLLGLTGVYFGGSMVRLALIVTPAAAVVAGYTLDEVLRPFALINQERFTISRRKKRATKPIGKELITIAYVFVAITLMLTAIFGINMTKTQYYMNHDLTPQLRKQDGSLFLANDYQQTFEWLRLNVAPYNLGEKPPVVLSWWDYGYKINILGNCKVLTDNGTVNKTQIAVTGAMFIHNESFSAKLMKKYYIDYVLVLSPGTVGSSNNDIYKSRWMMQIGEAYGTALDEYKIKYSDYYIEDPNADNVGFQTKFWESTVYKLCAYLLNKDGTYGGSQATIQQWRSGELQDAPDVTTLNNFALVFQSSHCMLRIYQVL